MLKLLEDEIAEKKETQESEPEKSPKIDKKAFSDDFLDKVYLWVKKKMQVGKWYNVKANFDALAEMIDYGCLPEIEFNTDKSKVRKIELELLT